MEQTGWSKSPRAIHMLLQLKEYVIANKDNKIMTDAAGCGAFAMAQLIDALVDDYNRTKTTLATIENERRIYYNVYKEWEEMGFDYTPTEYSDERQAELKVLAEKWNKEDSDAAE